MRTRLVGLVLAVVAVVPQIGTPIAGAHEGRRLRATMRSDGSVQVANSGRSGWITVKVKWNDWSCLDRGTCGGSNASGELEKEKWIPRGASRIYSFSYPSNATDVEFLHSHRS